MVAIARREAVSLAADTVDHSAFPTQFDVIPQQWIWSGVLSTLDSEGTSACVTHTTDFGTFSIDYFSQPEDNVMSVEAPYADDVRGWNFQPNHVVKQWPFTTDEIPGQAALSPPPDGCTQKGTAPLVEQMVDAYFVDTVTMTTGDSAKSSTTTAEDADSSPEVTVQPTSPLTSTEVEASTRTVVSEGSSGAETVTETVRSSPTTTSSGAIVSLPGCFLYVFALLAVVHAS